MTRMAVPLMPQGGRIIHITSIHGERAEVNASAYAMAKAALAEDLRGFLAHHKCARGVLVCTIPGPEQTPAKLGFTPAEVWTALDEGAPWVTPGVVYAAAAAQAGFSFVAAGRDAGLCAPGIPLLFGEQGLPIAGTVPQFPKGGVDQESPEQMFQLVESFRSLRMNVIHANGTGPVSITVSSPSPFQPQ